MRSMGVGSANLEGLARGPESDRPAGGMECIQYRYERLA